MQVKFEAFEVLESNGFNILKFLKRTSNLISYCSKKIKSPHDIYARMKIRWFVRQYKLAGQYVKDSGGNAIVG